jgi:hypothetical protein
LWKTGFLAFSQTKALSFVLLRYPKVSELPLTWSFNPQACFAFYGKLFSLFYMVSSFVKGSQEPSVLLGFWQE